MDGTKRVNTPSKKLDTELTKRLGARVVLGSKRALTVVNEAALAIDFFSNDYLGIAKQPEKIAVLAAKYLQASGTTEAAGSTGSRLLSGNAPIFSYVETEMAHYFKAEAALIFNAGYSANMGILSCLPTRSDCIFYDEYSHASLRDGIKLSNAKAYSFRHNDVADLAQKLERLMPKVGLTYVVIEALYSMDGDTAPLKALNVLCQAMGCILVVDEAHSFGLYGAEGRGLLAADGLDTEVPIRVYTFGKALGGHGACVVGSTVLIEALVNFSRPFIYTTAMPPRQVADMLAAVSLVSDADKDRFSIRLVHQMLVDGLKSIGIENVPSHFSPIVPLRLGAKAGQVAAKLRGNGIYTKAVHPPTVPEGEDMIRICCHSYNTADNVEVLIAAIRQALI